ncbi:MAG: hypothetical protein FJW20_14835 [Acidimicrobiia bacterium]|nr:hypothetical protein [Acidimicrobiia bacterium]
MNHRILLVSLLAALGVAADADWPRWRGPDLDGVARGDAPLSWGDDKNIAWKANIAGKGHSSPVIWGDKIFLTTAVQIGEAAAETAAAAPAPAPAPGGPGGRRGPGGPGGGGGAGGGAGALVEHNFDLVCLDRKTGKVIWQKTAVKATPHEGYHRRYGSFASHSPVTDGKHVIAFFGSRGVYAFDLNGNKVWGKDLDVKMRMRLAFGEGTPPTLYQDTLLLKFDQEGESFMIALDKNTGNEKWRVARDEQSSWSPPYVVEHGGKKQVVVSATNKVRSYDLAAGKLLWETPGLGSNVIPAPIYYKGIIYVMSGHRDPKLMAIKLTADGGFDSVAWSLDRGTSYTASPVFHDNILYFVTDSGMLTALNAATGEPYYHQQRLPKAYNFKASPVAAGGKLYLSTEDEDVVVVKLGQQFEVLATNKLTDQSFIASPAIADGEIYLRGQNTLFCIRGK